MPTNPTRSPRAEGDVQPMLERLAVTDQETGIQVVAYRATGRSFDMEDPCPGH